MSLFTPNGYTLIRSDGTQHNRIRGDLIPRGTREIIQDGRHFVATDGDDEVDFLVFREGYKSFVYRSDGEELSP